MSDTMKRSDISKEEIGQRLYRVTKEKSAERACEKIRTHLGVQWHELAPGEVDQLRVILEEAWACCDGSTWERIEFHNLSYEDVRKLLNTRRWSGDDLAAHKRSSDEVVRILTSGA